MNLRKFIAADMRDALAQIKRDLGPDAMIIATRPIRRGLLGQGVEVTAAVEIDEAPSKSATPPTATTPAQMSDAELERIMAPLRSELRSLKSHLRSLGTHDDM